MYFQTLEHRKLGGVEGVDAWLTQACGGELRVCRERALRWDQVALGVLGGTLPTGREDREGKHSKHNDEEAKSGLWDGASALG